MHIVHNYIQKLCCDLRQQLQWHILCHGVKTHH